MIKEWNAAYLNHFFRGKKYKFARLLISGKIDGKQSQGRKKLSWLQNLRKWNSIFNVETLFQKAKKARLNSY